MERGGLTRRLEGRYDSTGGEKGEGEWVEDYRGVTVMSVLYKIYTLALAERLRKEEM